MDEKEIKGQYNKEYAKNMVRKYMPLVAVVVTAAVFIIIFYFCVKRYTGLKDGVDKLFAVFQPILFGFVMAFLMNPIMMFLEKPFQNFFLKRGGEANKIKKHVRIITSVISLVILVGLVSVFLWAVIPEFIETVTFLVNNLTRQIGGVLDWANDITGGRYEESIMSVKNDEAINKALNKGLAYVQGYLNLDKQEELIRTITSWGYGLSRLVFNLIIGFFVSVYVLMEKEKFKGQAKKLIYGICSPKMGNEIMEFCRKTNDVFYGFIIGKIIDSIIIGIICYVGMIILGLPYKLLTSVIIGVTNIIPVFGPYIGAIPTVIIIFLTDPRSGIVFLIFVLVLQQFDGNLIGPKILGDSTGISNFWVIVSIVVGGGLFGFMGMLLGVPTMAMIYYVVGRVSRNLLKKRHLPTGTAKYIELDHIDEGNNALIPKDPEAVARRKAEATPKFLRQKKDRDSGENN